MLAYDAWVKNIKSHQISDLLAIVDKLNVSFSSERKYLNGIDVTQEIRAEHIGLLASQIASHALIRDALLDLQRSCFRPPGLVGDGRDMGTVVFPQADVKIFVTADIKIRAARRQKQLQLNKGKRFSFQKILEDLHVRDENDRNRLIAPLKPAKDAKFLDTTEMTPESAIKIIMDWCCANSQIKIFLKPSPVFDFI